MPEINALAPGFAVELMIRNVLLCYYSKATALLPKLYSKVLWYGSIWQYC